MYIHQYCLDVLHIQAHTWLSESPGMIKCLVLEHSQVKRTGESSGLVRGIATCMVLDIHVHPFTYVYHKPLYMYVYDQRKQVVTCMHHLEFLHTEI